MESSNLLSNYLLKRSSLESVLSFSKFETEVKKATGKTFSPSLLKKIYGDLSSQREQVLQTVQKTIDSEFNLPLKAVAGNPNHKNTPKSIQTLTTSIQKFEIELARQITPQINAINSLKVSLDKGSEKLNTIEPHEIDADQIEEVNAELSRLKSSFNLSTRV